MYAKLYLTGLGKYDRESLGRYIMVEQVDKPFLKRQNQIIDRLTRIIEHQAAFLPVQPAEGNDDKVIPISTAIRAAKRLKLKRV